jgi:hypothetical protein
MTAFATVIGWSEGMKNCQIRDLGQDKLENIGVMICPGSTSVVRTFLALYLVHHSADA